MIHDIVHLETWIWIHVHCISKIWTRLNFKKRDLYVLTITTVITSFSTVTAMFRSDWSLFDLYISNRGSCGSCSHHNPPFVALQQRQRQFNKSSGEGRGPLFFLFHSVILLCNQFFIIGARIGCKNLAKGPSCGEPIPQFVAKEKKVLPPYRLPPHPALRERPHVGDAKWNVGSCSGADTFVCPWLCVYLQYDG